jgi:homoserine/homoserine lactone efflux protein
MVLQLALTLIGMTSLLTAFGHWFEILRWVGVAYLAYLAVRAWRAPAQDLTRTSPQPRAARAIYLRGFLISLSNPKTLFFYGAFLPQFVSPHAPVLAQLGMLSATFLVMAVLFDSGWALLAGRFRRALAVSGVLRNRLTAGVYGAASVGLAADRRAY